MSKHRWRSATPSSCTAAARSGSTAVLAGSFADRSGPNCFGTVMSAAGVPGAENVWMGREPFEEWLGGTTTPIRSPASDAGPGVVLVWRRPDGVVDHAAVTIGDGYVLNKPSQAWCSPRFVWTVRETIRAAYQRGLRLHRYRIVGAR